MKCWRCEQEINNGTTECVYCHADLRRSTPTTDIGRGMRQLYDHYGAEAVLTNPVLLSNGLGDVVSDTLGINIKKLKGQLKMAMDAGLGRLYKEQIAAGKPDKKFTERVRILLIEDVGFNEKTANEMMGYFDEMIGWQSISKTPGKPDLPIIEINKQQIYEKAVRFMSSREYRKAMNLFEQIRGYKDTNDLIKQCEAKIDPSKPPKKGLIILICMLIAAAAVAFFVFQNALKKQRDAEATLQAYAIEQTGTVSAQLTIEAQQIADALETLQTQQTATQQAINATQTKLDEPTATQMPTNTKVPTATPDAQSLYEQGMTYYKDKNYTAALPYIQSASDMGYDEAITQMGIMYIYGNGVNKDETKGIKIIQEMADKGIPYAQYTLGRGYEDGVFGLRFNADKALYWYRNAADGKDINALYSLGRLYEYGSLGLKESLSTAFDYYLLAADLGHKYAQYIVGMMYFSGQGIKQSYANAVKYLEFASEDPNGNVSAMFMLGSLYQYGVGVTQNIQNSNNYFQQAADSGMAAARNRLNGTDNPYIDSSVPAPYRELISRANTYAHTGGIGSNIPSRDFYMVSSNGVSGYFVNDIDGNGVKELFFGYQNNYQIDNLYTIVNGQAVNLVSDHLDNLSGACYLRKNGIVVCYIHNYDEEPDWHQYNYYKINQGNLQFVESIHQIYPNNSDSNGEKLYRSYSPEHNLNGAYEITRKEYIYIRDEKYEEPTYILSLW